MVVRRHGSAPSRPPGPRPECATGTGPGRTVRDAGCHAHDVAAQRRLVRPAPDGLQQASPGQHPGGRARRLGRDGGARQLQRPHASGRRPASAAAGRPPVGHLRRAAHAGPGVGRRPRHQRLGPGGLRHRAGHRQQRAVVRSALAAGAASRGLQLQAAALGGITASASLAGGAWPGPPQRGQPIPVAVPAPTARVLRLTPGRLLIVHDGYSGVTVRLRVSGTYRQRRQAAPYWAATIRLRDVSGSPQDAVLSPDPLIVSPAAFGPGHLPVILASWVALPHLAEVSPDRYAGLAAGLQAMQARLQDPGQFTGLAVTTSLPQVLADTGRSLAVARSLLLVGALQLLLLAAAAIALCARLLAGQREAESALLAARGMARRQLARRAIAEAVVLAAGPAVAGAIAGSALAGLAAGARPAGRALVP